ncbi:ATP-binding cassette domain-containing protein [Granulicella cerasi]|uniref:ATP-binding cassette domain-containing protein n=1 Tax=Granulicella cerasi TaxID=741063 RepID=UPI0021E0B360|nr:ATP-binding cassette domain-containing protein [Granulicella cerasi]
MEVMQAPLLEALKLSHAYPLPGSWLQKRGVHEVLRDVSLRVQKGRTLGIVGESGSGKSTLCRMLLKLEQPTSGVVRFAGDDMRTFTAQQRKAFHRDVQAVFQDPLSSLNPRMRAASILAEPFDASGIRLAGDAGRERLAELMKLVGLDTALLSRYPRQLSGGQRQRLAIARALATEPQLIVADEPVTALDVSVQAQIMNLLRDLQDARGVSYVFVSHNLSMVRFLCHDIVVLQSGRVVERGAVEQVFEDPQHEYTQLLLRATPVPDPDAVWGHVERPRPLPVVCEEVEVAPGHFVLREGSRA